MPVMVICFILGVIYLLVNPLYLSTLIAGGIGIILAAAVPVLFLLSEYDAAPDPQNREKSIQLPEQLHRHAQYTVSPEGIRDNDDALVKWTAVEDIVQTDKYVFILVHPKKAVILPKRTFPDKAAANRFFQDVQTYLRPRGKKFNRRIIETVLSSKHFPAAPMKPRA